MPEHPEPSPTQLDVPLTRLDLPVGGPAADPWPDSEPTQPSDRPPARPRIPRRWLWGGGSVTAACSVAVFLLVLLWPAGTADPIPFRPLDPVAAVALADAEVSLARVYEDRILLAARRGQETVVAAADLVTGEVAWEQTVRQTPGVASLAVMDGVVLVFGEPVGGGGTRPVFGLDPATGTERWWRGYHRDDFWLLSGTVATLVDRQAAVVRGVDPASGQELWTVRFPGDESAAVVPVVSGADLAGRARLRNTHDVPRMDVRVVMIGADRSATVVDTGTGDLVGTGVSIASPADLVVGYDDRLYVAEEQDGYRLYAYDLGDLAAQPDILYRAPAAGRTPVGLVPCGEAQVCLLEEGGDQPEDVVALDLAGSEAWRRSVPDAAYLVPVGDSVVVGTDAPAVIAYDQDGREILNRPGVAARLDAANLLLWAADPASTWSDASVAGIAVLDGAAQRAELGQLRQVRAAGCTWDTRHLVCPTEEGAGVWSFVDP